ncbi:MAG: 30S ribosomal protein S1 [Nitrospira sp.]|nr:30S ribosomal protein S1 [Nitrospira sp.]
MNDLEKLYADSFKGLKAGSVTKGTVLQVKDDGIIVDVGSKSEGFVPRNEMAENDRTELKPGDEVEVFVERLYDEDGFVKLSRQRAEGLRAWDTIEDIYNNNQTIDGKITGKVKGGMTVTLGGISAFLPGSHIDLKAPKNTDHLIGQTHTFKVLNISNKGSNIIVSRRVLLEDERNKLRVETLKKIKEGEIVKGVIKNLTDYGVFIDLGGLDGLLHISDMSWGRISHPGEMFNIGDTVEVIVLTFDTQTEKVTLGYKQTKADPWLAVADKYPVGAKVSGKVITITEYGIFVELEEGVEGLIHVTEFDWTEKSAKPSKLFNIGDKVESVILKVSTTDKKISLSIKRLRPNPWEVVREKYTPGQKINVTAKSFTDFGAFMTLDEGIDALLHVSDISWHKRIKHPSDVLNKGQEYEVVILNIENDKERISVGLKQAGEDPWVSEIPKKYRIGDSVDGKIVSITEFGLFVELEDGIEGLIHKSEIERNIDDRMEDLFEVGKDLASRIINIDPSERKIDLSMRTMID